MLRKGDPELAREINKASILNLLRKSGRLSRAQISRLLLLSKITVSNIVSDLIDEKTVKEVGEGVSYKKGGRKPILLSLDTDNWFALGVDIGRANTTISFCNLKGEIQYKKREATCKNCTPEAIVAQVGKLIEQTIEKASLKKDQILGMGISIGGIIERAHGFVRFSPDFGWEDIALQRLLEEQCGLDVIVENCTRAMLLGEKWYGCAQDNKNLLYINLGYGIGSALIINNRIYDNHSEFGHTSVTGQKLRCSCGKTGCLEAVASGHAIEQTINEAVKSDTWITAKDAVEMAANGNLLFKKIFADAGRYLGQAISSAANLLKPDRIIIGGGISLSGDLLFRTLLEAYQTHTMEIIKLGIKIERSALGLDAGCEGATALVLNDKVFNTELVDQ